MPEDQQKSSEVIKTIQNSNIISFKCSKFDLLERKILNHSDKVKKNDQAY